jgi:Outer membrane protein
MKRIICACLALLLVLSGITVAFAAESNKTATTAAAATTSSAVNTTTTAPAVTTTAPAVNTTTTPAVNTTTPAVDTTGTAVIVKDMTFTGNPIKLSLDAAYKKMLADSPKAQIAELNKQSAVGVANGYGESVHLMNQAKESGLDYSTTDKNVLKLQQEYAVTQGPKNYEAEINKLKSDTLNNYFQLKELENQVQIAKDNLDLKNKLLSNTQLKYKLGTVSKSDVLKAETAVYEAKDSLLAAQDGLNKMKMGFNQFMGYDNLMQNVTLTDTIKEIPLPTKSLEASIKDALANRNEMSEADFNLKVSTLNLNNFKAYPISSSKYIKAKMSMLMAETSKKNAPLTVESDVRTKYMAMNEKYSAVQTGKKSVENAKETERLAQLQYDAGMATLPDVESAQLAYYNEQLSYSKALLEYNLAVNDYMLSSTVGTDTNTI